MNTPRIALEGQAGVGDRIRDPITGEEYTIYEIASGKLPTPTRPLNGYGHGTGERCTRFGEPTRRERDSRVAEQRRLQHGQRRRVQS